MRSKDQYRRLAAVYAEGKPGWYKTYVERAVAGVCDQLPWSEAEKDDLGITMRLGNLEGDINCMIRDDLKRDGVKPPEDYEELCERGGVEDYSDFASYEQLRDELRITT